MPVQTDQAVVLRLADYSESSQVVSLFTARSGLVRLLFKGARRSSRTRVATGLDLLEYGTLGYAPARAGAGLGILTEWVQLDAFTGLRSDLFCQYAAFYAAESISRLTEEYDPHPELFAALLALLRGLAGSTSQPQAPGSPSSPAACLVQFQTALLRAIGYAPVLSRCVGCGRSQTRGTVAYFSSTAGGLLCRDCEMHHAEKRRLPPGLLDADAAARSAAEWFALLDYHLTHIAGGPLHTAQTLHTLLKNPGRGGA